jgi:nucleotide-binding universal stress UspA family protein
MPSKVLLPVDGSPASLHAARYVARNLQGLDASVVLLNVQQVYVDAELLHASRAIFNLHRKEGEAAMREAAAILDAAGIEHEARVAFGRVPEIITRTALLESCRAIVMGTRARHPLVDFLTRSVPTRVVRRSRLPVVLVRHETQQRSRGDALEARITAA